MTILKTEEQINEYYDQEYGKKFTKKQIEWMKNFERETGFEVIDDNYSDFSKLKAASVRWFEMWMNDTYKRINEEI